jgi:succinate-semialdehyde dehydrogenase/glutarate-semialdehyde dehydrogenase
VPQCALALEAVFSEAGFIPGSFNTLLIGSGKVSQLLRDSRVRAATLTGSEGAGIAVASEAAANLKKTVLELGGSDPFIVMPSAVLDDAVQTAVTARLQNNGQSCIAAKRFIVHDAIYEDFRARFVQAFEAQVIGPPDREDTDIGPLALAEGVKDLHDQVQRSIAAGASLITGGEPMSGDGFYFKPGILEAHDATLADPVFAEELFGPVALLTRVASLEAAIQTANATSFGLGSALFTRDQEDIEKAVNDLQAGATFINAMVASDPRLPFGGIKRSGYGRELAAEGIREFTNQKTVSIH